MGEIFMEKRRHKRAELKFKVLYKPASKSESDGRIKEKKEVKSADISINGIQLICDEAFNIDDMLRLDIMIEGEANPIQTFAEVRWTSHDTELDKYRIGLEFLVVKEDHCKLIKNMTGE